MTVVPIKNNNGIQNGAPRLCVMVTIYIKYLVCGAQCLNKKERLHVACHKNAMSNEIKSTIHVVRVQMC